MHCVGGSRMGVIRKVLPLLICFALLLANNASGRHHRLAIEKEVSDLKTQLESIRKNSIKTIQIAGGDVYDCVDIYKQPAFLHPNLKDHEVQMKPTIFPTDLSTTDDGIEDEVQFSSEEECPQGSVPIQRLDLDKLARDKFVLGSKVMSSQKLLEDGVNEFWAIHSGECYDHGALLYAGGGAAINTYAIPDVGPHDNTGAMMCVTNREIGAILKAGWRVRPEHAEDTKTRLFIEWSNDSDVTMCADAQCPGFVLTNPKPTLGMALAPLSTYMGPQYVLRVYIYMDPKTGNWWFGFGKRQTPVGYWPKAIFNDTFTYSNRIDYGGLVSCPSHERCPRMCNGVLAGTFRGGLFRSCFVRDVQYYNKRGQAFYFTKAETMSYVTDTNFSTVSEFKDDIHGFNFGGPGY